MTIKSPHTFSTERAYKNFRVTKMLDIDELQCQLIELIHVPTGARVMHIANDDPENLFCLGFQTIPTTSDGIAHILEHTVLCGSEHFPVKDPFFSMTRRSLNTYMNALTGQDFTCYPAASQVPKDFYNLLEVYLDAVFRPNLNHLSFLQEGHRLEFQDPADPSSPLEYKGIVFNEMKGAMADPNRRLIETMNHALFPDLTYGCNSGGDPKVIPQLTYEQLRNFHQTYYHPSRCLFFFYGNLSLEQHLDFIAENTLDRAEKCNPLPSLPKQTRFSQSKQITLHYPVSPIAKTENKGMVAFGWLTAPVIEQEELLALTTLDIALLDNDASPLKSRLLKSGLCTEVNSYLDCDISEAPLIITLKGCNANQADAIEALLKTALKEIADEGISPALIDSALHQLEFHRSEITGNRTPFGLSLFMRSALLKLHGAAPEEGLIIHTLFDKIRSNFEKNPDYFIDLLQKYLLNNAHFARVVMTPDAELAAKEIAEEKASLADIRQKLSAEDVQSIIDQAAELAAFQEKQEGQDLEILPKVSLSDVPKNSRNYPLTQEKAGNLDVFHHACFTNNIVYANLVFPLPDIVQEEMSFVRLLTTLLPQVGSGGRDYAETLEQIHAHTGGIAGALSLNIQADNCSAFSPSLHIHGRALQRKVDKLFPLLYDTVASADFTDVARLKEIILKQHTLLTNSLNQNAMNYAMSLSASGLSVSSSISNSWHGLEYFWKIRNIALNFDQHANTLVASLQKLQKQLLCLEGPHLVLTCNQETYGALKKQKFYGLQDIETHPYETWKGNYSLPEIKSQGRVIGSPVAFTSQAFKTVNYQHLQAPALAVASNLFDNLVLHKSIREEGGAYGGGASSNSLSGNFHFYSYRDPNLAATLKAFGQSVDRIVQGNFEASDLEEAKLEVIQAVDTPIAPGSRGSAAYAWLQEGRTLEVRQAFRDKILALTSEEVQQAVKDQITPKLDAAIVVSFAGEELLKKETAKLQKPLKIEPI